MEPLSGGREESPKGLTRTVTSSASATLAVFGVNRLLQLVFIAILGRLLTPADFGVVAAALVFISFVQIFSELGVGTALTQARVVTDRMIAAANGIILVARFALFALALLTAPLVAAWFRNPDLIAPIRWLSAVLLFQAYATVPQALMFRSFRARDVSLIELASGIVGNILVAVPLALLGYSYWALVAGTLGQTLVKSVMLNLAIPVPRKASFSLDEAKRLLAKGSGFSLAVVFNRVAQEGANLVVGRYMSTHMLGLFSRSYALMVTPSRVYQMAVDRVLFPALAQVQDRPERLRRGFLDAMTLTASGGLPLAALMVLLAPELIAVMLGGQWGGAIVPFQILSFAIYFRVSHKVGGTVLRATGRAYRLAGFQFIYAALILVGCFLAYPYGIAGVAAAVTAVIMLLWVLITVSASRATGVGLVDQLRAHGSGAAGTLLVSAVALPLAWGCRDLGFPPVATLAAAISACGIVLLAAATIAPGVFLGQSGRRLAGAMRHIAAARLARLRGRRS